MVALIIASFTGVAGAQIYVDDDFVDDPTNHKWNTIPEGINDANDGDTVLVYNGLYIENVVVNKSIKLRGEDRDNTIIDGGGSGSAIHVTADGCEISEFTVRNSGESQYTPISCAGINLGSDNNILTNNTASYNECGIHLTSSSGNILTNNIASHNVIGITLWGYKSNNNTLTNNNASCNDGRGIFLWSSSSGNRLKNNIASHNGDGIVLFGWSCTGASSSINANTLSYNTLTNNKYYGIYLSNSDDNYITCNYVSHNNKSGFYLSDRMIEGYHLSDGSTGNWIEQNNILMNGQYNTTSGGYEWNFVNNQSCAIEAKHNYWGATENSTIDASVYNDEEGEGKVEFYPFATKPVLCALGTKLQANVFDTKKPVNPYPSIFGTHKGTITPNVTIEVSSLYTYPCAGTSGHTKYARIWNDTWSGKDAYGVGYEGDWHNVTFEGPVTLFADKRYYYEIRTGSYPQIHHTEALPTAKGWINGTSFTDANGKNYTDCIPAIKLVGSPVPDIEKLTLLGWWRPSWSEDGAELDVRYTKGNGTLTQVSHTEDWYDPYGVVGKRKIINVEGEDIYGRVHNETSIILYQWIGGSVKPVSAVAQGTFTYPAGTVFEQNGFARSLEITQSYEYDSNGRLKGSSSNEEFYGHISTTAGIITYSGSATASITVRDGQPVMTESTETTNYYYNGKYYAETLVVNTFQYEYLGGKWTNVRVTVKTTTNYADGSERESVIVILWQRQEGGVTTGKSGSGTITGTEVMNGKTVSYTGSVTLDYVFDVDESGEGIGWYKSGYSETMSAEAELPKRLPFEVIFIDDLIF